MFIFHTATKNEGTESSSPKETTESEEREGGGFERVGGIDGVRGKMVGCRKERDGGIKFIREREGRERGKGMRERPRERERETPVCRLFQKQTVKIKER